MFLISLKKQRQWQKKVLTLPWPYLSTCQHLFPFTLPSFLLLSKKCLRSYARAIDSNPSYHSGRLPQESFPLSPASIVCFFSTRLFLLMYKCQELRRVWGFTLLTGHKLACHSFMVAGKSHKLLGSLTKDLIADSNGSSQRISILLCWLHEPQFPQSDAKRARWYLHT